MSTLFYTLAGKGDEDGLRAWLEENRKRPGAEELVDRPDAYGLTALHWAAQSGRENTMRLLMDEYHASPAVVTTYERFTLLHSAVQSGSLSCVRYALTTLCQRNPAVDPAMARNNAHLTPTQLAERLGHQEVYDFLLAHAPRSADSKQSASSSASASAEPTVTIVRAASASQSPAVTSAQTTVPPQRAVLHQAQLVPAPASGAHAIRAAHPPHSSAPELELQRRERELLEREAAVSHREAALSEREARLEESEARLREQALRLKRLMAEHSSG
mmetsp:Transcript_7372/g.18608  ORF Transcript_7372/g.18608 Transcript_7372/m.18608 type:complete len:273 (+) Transcript_7372:155-973(+)|eukprot:CAMPEP_0177629804 /NCGR_PEP_ID=MMETSP0447-20121125/862_1 /TAXON_ID=0 /ORGANISM="Stygamoeba regulata, Strain BSH-02190019" /LENGTH=272 /DNA_ID=CAMNT_0019131147 /DNA_START=196 /DNA_END=1014 /DNA_ORIENTATION=+